MQSWKEKRSTANKCNDTAVPKTCQPNRQAYVIGRRFPRVADLQSQQILTDPGNEKRNEMAGRWTRGIDRHRRHCDRDRPWGQLAPDVEGLRDQRCSSSDSN